ncbi:uncharacterized protein LOC123498204 [Portunus trituberculatus]|uniref:uncharacterized protein LOC123498204 n=1 Tax=Portunus trituberculatus TaxID=210409 RepID=UPI001E1CB621|nr:uncharacterized protein LOC123498204 [Portunus trituberculatus]
MDDLKRERANAKRRFTRKVGLFKDAHKRGNSTATLQVLYSEVCDSFKVVDVVNEKIIDLLDGSSSCQEYEDYIMELETIKCTLLETLKEKPKAVLAMKKIEPPKFGGSVRSFPSFIRDYTRLVESQHGEDPYVLRMSLEGEPRRLVEDLNDYKRMWERLNETYGHEGKLIDSILGDIRSYKPISEGDDKRLIKLINTVEKVWLDVSNLNLTKELENVTVLTQVEKLLPSMLKKEWASKVQQVKTDKFKELVAFLTEHRKL